MANKTARPADNAAATMDAAFKGCADAVHACFDAQRRMLDEAFGLQRRVADGRLPMVEEMTAAANRFGRASIELGTRAMSELNDMAADQARFAGAMADRMVDLASGTHGARTPESLLATGQSMATDCLEHGAAVAQRAVAMGARNADAFQSMMSGFATRTAQAVAEAKA